MQDASQPQPIDGVFTPRLVARLHRDAFDGTLRFNAAGATRVIYFRRGEIASAASNAEDDRLHNILIRDGRLTPPQLEMARARQQPGASLGKTLIELGFLTPAELLQGARRQVRLILAACFGLTSGTYQTNPGPLPAAVTALGLPARRLIFDALLESGDRQAVVREMGSMESIYRPADATLAGVAAMRLDPPIEKVASLLDGRMTLRDISGRTALDDFTVSKVVLGLEILGLAEMQSPPPEAATVVGRPAEALEAAPAEAVVALPAAARHGSQSRRIPIETESAGLQDDSAPADIPSLPLELPRDEHPERMEQRLDPDEMPAFPRDELPAFALPPDEPPVGWQVDPETGDRVHAGPIELTFDGTMAPPAEPRSLASRFAAVAAVAGVVVAAALLAVFLRRQPGGPAEEASAGAAPAERDAASAPTATVEPPAEPPAKPPARQPERQPARKAALEPDQAPQPTPPKAPPQAPPVSDRAEPPANGPAAPPRPDQNAETPPEVARQEAPGGARFADAQRLVDTGQIDVAAAAFRGLVIEEGPDSFTLQLLIACDPETIRHARAATPKDSPLFVVPFAMQGRSCYRACWGMYRAKAAALAAASTLPPYFSSAGVAPVVVSFGRLVPPS